MKEYGFWLLKCVTLIVMVFIIVPLVIGGIYGACTSVIQKTTSDTSDKPAVAVVEVNGELKDSHEVVESLYKYAEDKNIKGIVLHVNSPGGSAGIAQEIHHAVLAVKAYKPVVAVMGEIAASGGLFISVAATKILCLPDTLTGSIGVIIQSPNYAGIASKVGYSVTTLKAGAHKDIGDPFRDMTDEEKQIMQNALSITYKHFIDIVSKGRNIPFEEVQKYADGHVLMGSEALDLKLVDGYGDVIDGAREVYKMTNTPLGEKEFPVLIRKEDKISKIKDLFKTLIDMTPFKVGSNMPLPRYQMY